VVVRFQEAQKGVEIVHANFSARTANHSSADSSTDSNTNGCTNCCADSSTDAFPNISTDS